MISRRKAACPGGRLSHSWMPALFPSRKSDAAATWTGLPGSASAKHSRREASMPTPNISVVRRAAEELSDEQIERLMDFGRREADLIEQMEAAARDGDRDLVWQI